MTRVKFSRQIYPSLGLTLSRPDWSFERNQKVFGSLNTQSPQAVGLKVPASQHELLGGWGKNLQIASTWEAEQEPQTGFVVSLADCDLDLAELQTSLDHRYLNSDVEFFKSHVPTIENIALFSFNYLKALKLGSHLAKVSVQDQGVCIAQAIDTQNICISYQFSLSVLHRHHRVDLSEDENMNLYGKCSRVHGHRYEVELVFSGEPDLSSGLLISPDVVRQTFETQIKNRFEGRFLNDEFGNTSGELIISRLYEILRIHFDSDLFRGIRLKETRKNSFSLLPNFDLKKYMDLDPMGGGSL